MSINTCIFNDHSISINTNIHMMICIRRNIGISITLEFRFELKSALILAV